MFPVHGVGGILGTLLAAVFSSTQLGAFSGFGHAEGIGSIGAQFGVQLTGVVATIVYTAVMTWLILKLVGLFSTLRADEESETKGLDIVEHEERGYNL